MRGRRIWALLAVAAVLAMHGVQCMGGVVDSTSTPPAAVAPSDSHHGAAASTADGMHHVTTPASTHQDAAPHGMPAHGADVWTVCLSVLFTALTSLGVAVLLRGRTTLSLRGPPPSVRRLRHLLRPAPAPDLASLCLLRI
ncbi:hypothetical protein GCM10023328_22370 [Modestobacter marinus]|uniref:Uncharacterized protein n=1 Tax=Modestobacter marinus TaxID=477641 RepID=A0A846LRF7_9ACTN|nr:DUF6153 family protein [Modestobacter marinus]NIH70116.1 hypothetical protein [Modestobacter marinus]GGL84086.1 hypothetical protein GCM10011589_45690 [Modestobacter marinus]